MFDKEKKIFGLILIGLTMLAGLFGCSDSSSNAPEENDRIVGEVGTGAARCKALSIECGYGYDYQANETVDLWELSAEVRTGYSKRNMQMVVYVVRHLQNLVGGDGFQILKHI